MLDFEKKDFEKLLKSGGLSARRWMKSSDSTVARVYDRNIESLPLTLDLYDKYARIMDYSEEPRSEEEILDIIDIVSRYLYIEKKNIIYKERKKREGREQHEKGDESLVVTVKENGLEFECELKLYADTGLFLDLEEERKLLLDMAMGQRVLNLFSYTSSFSLYAAKGGAEEVTSVDLSNVYSEWSRRNFVRNGFLDETRYRIVTGDCRDFLEKEIENKKKYDIVIFDPPAFSNSHKALDFDVQKDYMDFLFLIRELLSDEGVVLFSENKQGFRFEKKKLDEYWEIKELTKEVKAINFSEKTRSVRVWLLEKNAVKCRRNIIGKRKMENEKIEERLNLSIEENEEKSEVSSSPREFSFDDNEKSLVKEEKKDFSSRNEDSPRREERKPRYSDDERRGGERRYSGERRGSRDDRPRRDYRDGDRPRYSDNRRDDRPHYDDRKSRYSDDRPSYRDDRRDDRPRYDDRRPRYSDDRRDDRPRYRDDRRDNKPRYSDDRKSYREERRGYDRENETSRMYRSERENRPREERRRESPKPFGYDSFQENRNREGATTYWLQGQSVKVDKKKEDEE